MNKAALYIIIGTLSGAFFTHQWHSVKASNLAEQQRLAWEANNESIKASSKHWQEKLDNANSREPVTVERRVYVNAPVQESCGDTVDGAGTTARYEFDNASVRRLESITARAEQQYRECSYRLKAWQDSFKGVK